MADQQQALSAVFSPARTLTGGTTNLAGELNLAAQQVFYAEVVDAATKDSGKGVQVAWSGLPDADSVPPGTPITAAATPGPVVLPPVTRSRFRSG
jgi:hypothetical protein